jgi:hypothetical protein
MSEIPFWKGKDAKLVITFLAEKLIIDHTDWQVTREGDEIEDDICGEDRARLDFVTSHFGVEINAMQQNVDLMKAFIKEQKAKDLRSIPKDSSIGILIFPNNGTQAAFQMRNYVLGKWKAGYSGRKERNKVAMPGRCRYFDELPTL